MKMKNNIYLLIFIITVLYIINNNKPKKEDYINLKYDYCKEYEDNNQDCPYRIKYKSGIPQINQSFKMNTNSVNQTNCKIKPLYDQNLLSEQQMIIKPQCADKKQVEFIKFAGKYPVAIKSNNNINVCGK